MYSLFRKEMTQFWGSLTGTLVAVVFLAVTGLFLWVFPGNYNILQSGYASLQGLFELAPWIYLFLIPAVTMRMFADEQRSGTLELLLVRPLSELQLILAKFLAALSVVLLTLLPTLIYVFSVYHLGSPVGSIDLGATWGSYAGLFFLAVIYLTIGLFTSSLSENQVVGFILAVLMSFFWYAGFDFVAQLPWPASLGGLIQHIGIASHYESVSRGVIDSRDIYYFVGTATLFVLSTRLSLLRNRKAVGRPAIKLLLFFAVLIVGSYALNNSYLRLDLTSEKRFTLSKPTRQFLAGVHAPIGAELLLAGDLPPGFQRLQKGVEEMLHDMQNSCDQPIEMVITDPYKVADKKNYFQRLLDQGIVPVNLRINSERGVSNKTVFPVLLLRGNGGELAINLLKNDPFLNEEENLIHSTELLEYEIVQGMKNLLQEHRSRIGFLTGHDELDELQLRDINSSLLQGYDLSRLEASTLPGPDSLKLLVVANPMKPFLECEKFAIDQYLMRGGRILWLVDPVQVSLDSLSTGMSTMALPRDLNLDDQLFHYGVRLNYDLLQDVDCQQIKVNTAQAGQSPRYTLAAWYFSPLLTPTQNHPIGKNVNRVLSEFVSSIDLVSPSEKVKSTVLLTTSANARINRSPLMVSLAMIDAPPARSLFTQSNLVTGVLEEGVFTSVFKNRMVKNCGSLIDQPLIAVSKPTRMIFLSDGGLMASKLAKANGKVMPYPLGYDKNSSVTFGNKEFLLNAIHYLCDDSGLLGLRSRTLTMRLLDKVKVREERTFWMWTNVITPVVLLMLGGLLFNGIRKRRYAKGGGAHRKG